MPRKPWFAPKRYGYGAGAPIAWEGWLTLFVYLVVVTLAPLLLWPVLGVGVVIGATIVLGMVCATRTDGGWRWRNGS